MLFHSFCGSRMTWDSVERVWLSQGLAYSSSWDVDGDAVIQRREQGWRIHFWDCPLPRGQPAGSLTYPSHGPRHCLRVGSMHRGSWFPQEQVIWKIARHKSHYFMNTPCKTKAVTWAFWKWGVLNYLVNMFLNHCCFTGGYPSGSVVKKICLPRQEMQEMWVGSLGQEDLLEEEMATYSSILAWKIPWTVGPGRLQFMGSQRVGHDWARMQQFHWPKLIT